jgi:molecular chaperone DnaK (HSP70)
LEQLNSITNAKKLFMDEIQWVITVPTIWSNAAKQVMRTAAQKAGLPKSTTIFLLFLPNIIKTCQI